MISISLSLSPSSLPTWTLWDKHVPRGPKQLLEKPTKTRTLTDSVLDRPADILTAIQRVQCYDADDFELLCRLGSLSSASISRLGFYSMK